MKILATESIDDKEIEEVGSIKEKKKDLKNKKIRGKQGRPATRDEIKKATKKFLKGGGKITKVVSQLEEF